MKPAPRALACGAAALLFVSMACGGSTASREPTPSAPRTAQQAPSATRAVQTPAATAPAATATPTEAVAPPEGPTATPIRSPAAPEVPTATASPAPRAVAIALVAERGAFFPGALSASAGSTLTVTLENRDAGVGHDVSFYTPSGSLAGRTPVIAGPAQASLTFETAEPGPYRFVCTVHPLQMTGVLTVE